MKSAFSTLWHLGEINYVNVGYTHVNLIYWLEKDPLKVQMYICHRMVLYIWVKLFEHTCTWEFLFCAKLRKAMLLFLRLQAWADSMILIILFTS